MADAPEPTDATTIEMGRLCMAWSVLEGRTEATLWGILGADEKLGPIITWRLDLRGRWQLVLEHAPTRHNREEVEELRSINKSLTPVMRDRNIIIHGLVHAIMEILGDRRPASGEVIPGGLAGPHTFARKPCWTVYRGSEAGKNFPISRDAVEIVRENVLKITDRVVAFNNAHNYKTTFRPRDTIEVDWPKRIE